MICDACDATPWQNALAMVKDHLSYRKGEAWTDFVASSVFPAQGLQQASFMVAETKQSSTANALQKEILAYAAGEYILWTDETITLVHLSLIIVSRDRRADVGLGRFRVRQVP